MEQIDAYIYSKFIFNKGAKAINGGNMVFSRNSAERRGIHRREN